MMNTEIKHKVLDWIEEKITQGETSFNVCSCTYDIGLDPFNKQDYACVEEVFTWHQSMVNHLYDICFEENT